MFTAVEVVGDVRVRTQQHIAVRLSDSLALAVALAGATIEGQNLIEYAFSGTVRTDALAQRRPLSLTASEFATLFGARDDGRAAPACAQVSKRIVELDGSPEGASARRRLEAALRCTLSEQASAAIWKRHPGVRLAAVAALHRAEGANEALEAVLGGFVAIDGRRVDDLKIAIEDDGVELIFVSEVLGALAECAAL